MIDVNKGDLEIQLNSGSMCELQHYHKCKYIQIQMGQ